MNAVLGVSQLKRLDAFIDRRTEIAHQYIEGLKDVDGIEPLSRPSWEHRHAWHLFVVRVIQEQAGLDRDQFMASLKDHGIGTGLHFRAAHTHRWYRDQKNHGDSLSETEWNNDRICSIPLFPDMTNEDVDRVLTGIRSVCNAAQVQGASI